jgi:chromosome segregation ATPase
LNQEITQRNAAEAELKIRIESYLKDITSLREHLSRKEQEINQLKADFEAKIALLNTEYSKLQNILNIKLRDIEALNGELKVKVVLIQELEEKNRFLQGENEKWKLSYQSKVAEVEQWKLKYSSLEQACQEKQATIEELTFTIEKLRTQVNKANEELLISQRRITELTVQINDLNGRVLELEGKVALLASENLRISKLLSQKSYELDAAKNEISVKLLIIAEMEEKLKGLTVELDRISALLVTKRSELDEWKARCGSLENRIHDFEISMQTHKEDNEKFKRAGQKNNDSIAGHMKKIAELNALIHELNLKLEDRDGRINILSQENERVNKILVVKTKEFDDNKLNYERKSGENDELQSLINNL